MKKDCPFKYKSQRLNKKGEEVMSDFYERSRYIYNTFCFSDYNSIGFNNPEHIENFCCCNITKTECIKEKFCPIFKGGIKT